MTWFAEHWMQLLFVAGFLALLVRHAWEAHRASTEDDEGPNRARMKPWMIAISFYATFVSTNTFIGHAGKSWDIGLVWYVKLVFYLVFVWVAWFVLAPKYIAIRQQYDAHTLPAVLGARYRSPLLRKTCSGIVLGASLLYLVAVYTGSALALQEFFGLDYRLAAVLIFVVVTGYTSVGGFRAVVLTDVVQGLFLAVGAVAVLVGVLYAGGGLSAICSTVEAKNPNLVSWKGNVPWLTLIGLSLAGSMKLLVDPKQVDRFNGLAVGIDSPSALRRAGLLSLGLMVVTYLCLLPVGVFAHALIPDDAVHTTDRIMPYLLGTKKILGPGVSSFFLLVLLAGAMSSLDSVLLVASSTVHSDLLPRADEESKAKRPWLWTVCLSVTALLLSFAPFGDIVEITAFSGSLYAACFIPTLLVGLYWKRGTSAGALACVLLGSVTVVGWYIAKRTGLTSWHEIFVGLAVGMTAYFAVSMLTSRATENSAPERERAEVTV